VRNDLGKSLTAIFKIFLFFDFFLALSRTGGTRGGICSRPINHSPVSLASMGKSTMANPALDSQIKIALRDDKTAEKFAEILLSWQRRLSTRLSNFLRMLRALTSRFQKGDSATRILTKSIKPSSPWVRSAFLCMLSIDFFPMDTRIMRDMVFDFIFGNAVQPVYAKSFTGPPAQAEKFVLDHFDRLTWQLAEAPAIFGEGPDDRNSAMWRACRAICVEDLGRDDRRLLIMVGNHLMRGLEDLTLADKIAAMAGVLRLPGYLQKIA
jgi:hypothetical protein